MLLHVLFPTATATLTTVNFANHSNFCAAHSLVLVLYSASWCSYSERLLPTLGQAAELLAAAPSGVAIAQSTDARLAEAAGADAVPALRLHRAPCRPEESEAYDGPLEAASLAAYLHREARPAAPLAVSTAEALQAELAAAPVAVVLFAPAGGAEAAALAALAADRALLRRTAVLLADPALLPPFAAADAAEAAEAAAAAATAAGAEPPDTAAPPAEGPQLFLFRNLRTEDEEMARYKGDLRDAAAMRTFVDARRLPLLAEISAHNFRSYQEAAAGGSADSQPLFWLFVNASCCATANRQARAAVRAAARSLRGAASFVWLDGEQHAQHARSLAAAGALPAVAAEARGEHYVFEGRVGQPDEVTAWASSVVAGERRPTLRSAAPPLDNLGAVTVVVGASFDALVLRSKADVLLLVHAPWCAACGPLRDAVEQFGERWEGERKLRVASFDVGANDLPASLRVESLPALLFFAAPAAQTSGIRALDWSGVATGAQLDSLVQQHASAPLTRPADAAELRRMLDAVPAFKAEAERLLAQNDAQRAELRRLRATAAREAGRAEAMEARLQAQLRGAPGADGEGDEEATFEAVAADDDSAAAAEGEGDEEMLRVRVQSSDGSEQEVMMSRSSLDALIAQQQEQQQE